MNVFRSILAVSAAGLLLFAPAAQAQWQDGGQGRPGLRDREARTERIYAQLNLSEEQKQLLKENKRRHKAASLTLARDSRSAMDQVGDELKKKDMDRGKLTALFASVKSLHDQMLDEKFNSILEVRKILTQEQFARFIELLDHQKRSRREPRDEG